MEIVLYEPEIPGNTGNIARLCAANHMTLHLIKPLGFSIDDKHVKRAGLDYWHLVDVQVHENIQELYEKYPDRRYFYATTKAKHTHSEVKYEIGDMLVCQIKESCSISAGLDFPAVGPQHAYLNSIGRAEYVSVTDDEALAAFKTLSRSEGIIPALESSHALAHALRMMRDNPQQEQLLVVNLSGRGDKDIFTVHDILQARGEM